MRSVRIEPNGDGTYTAWIYSTNFTGTYDQCKAWVQAHGENI
jgi:hypothetical protein